MLTSLVLVVGCCRLPTCVTMAFECGWCPRVWRWQLEVVGVHSFSGANWMWLVPACEALAVGCDWVPKCVGMAIGNDWFPRVWWCQVDAVGARVCGCDSWMCLMPTCLAMAIGCDWYPRVCWGQMDVVGVHVYGGYS